jgi:membrane associated rhomboid family serine protease
MLIPINTDAPLYHFPYATIGLIIANTVCFTATGFAMNDGLLEPWLLEYGNGLNPLEWIPAAFAHGGFMHLIGNMFFLWGFGLVVEGKLGWRVFVPLYLAMAAAWGAGVDLLTLHRTDSYVLQHVFEVSSKEELESQLFAEGLTPEILGVATQDQIVDKIISIAKGRCLGASGVIFALMAISLVWAPKNEMHIVGLLGFRLVSFDVTIMTYSLWYLALNVLELMFSQFEMGSSGLHMVGVFVGLGVGVVYLRKGWVDCENWDLFSVLSGKYGRFAEENWALGSHSRTEKMYSELPVPEAVDDAESETSGRASSARAKKNQKTISGVNSLIDSGDWLTAADELFNLRLRDETFCPDQARTRKLAIGLLQAQAFDEAELWLQEFIDRFPEDNAWARIRMAQLLLTKRQRPSAALRCLTNLPSESLPEQLKALAKKIASTAKEQIRDGVKDAESEW